MIGITKPVVLFLYANDPDPALTERMRFLYQSDEYQAYTLYWHRKSSSISIPFSSDLPQESLIPVSLPDPRGNILRRLVLSLRFARAAWSAERRLKPQIIHTFYPDMLTVARLVLLFRRKTGLVYEIPDITNKRLIAPIRWLYRWLLKRTDTVLLTSDRFRTAFLDRYRLISRAKPIDFISSSPESSHFAGFKRRQSSDLIVGYIGNFRGQRQIVNLANATASLRQTGRDIRLLFAGAGRESSVVRSLANSHSFIEMYGSFDYWADIISLYERTDIIFAVYPQEDLNFRVHLARRFSEGIVCGLPLIVAEGSYMAEIVEQESVGWSVGHDSETDLVDLLGHVYDNRTELVARGRASRALRQHHSFETHAPALLKAYRHILGARAPEATVLQD